MIVRCVNVLEEILSWELQQTFLKHTYIWELKSQVLSGLSAVCKNKWKEQCCFVGSKLYIIFTQPSQKDFFKLKELRDI